MDFIKTNGLPDSSTLTHSQASFMLWQQIERVMPTESKQMRSECDQSDEESRRPVFSRSPKCARWWHLCLNLELHFLFEWKPWDLDSLQFGLFWHTSFQFFRTAWPVPVLRFKMEKDSYCYCCVTKRGNILTANVKSLDKVQVRS